MKKTLIVFILLMNLTLSAQENYFIDSKYLTALIYLKTNSDINKEIKKFKNQWLKKEKVKNNNVEQFNISKFISYLPIPDLKIELNDNYSRTDSKLHREKYYFDLEENILLQKLIPNSQSQLYLLFSKPIDNYLIAEFMINITGNEIDMVKHKDGPTMHLLFVFEENNIVKEVFISRSYYH